MTFSARPKRQALYRAYLVRMWQVESRGRLVWRASVEDSRTGERRGFADIARLHTYLDEQAGLAARAPQPATAPRRGKS